MPLPFTPTTGFGKKHAVNPINGEHIPVFAADYVLAHYGTGAIMAVPGHDERDFAFARAYDLPIPCVVEPPDDWFDGQGLTHGAPTSEWTEAYVGPGRATASANADVSLDETE